MGFGNRPNYRTHRCRYRCHVIFSAKWGVRWPMPLTFITLLATWVSSNVFWFIVFSALARILLKLWRTQRRKVFRKLPNAIYLIGSKSLGSPISISRSLTLSCHRSFLPVLPISFPTFARLHVKWLAGWGNFTI